MARKKGLITHLIAKLNQLQGSSQSWKMDITKHFESTRARRAAEKEKKLKLAAQEEEAHQHLGFRNGKCIKHDLSNCPMCKPIKEDKCNAGFRVLNVRKVAYTANDVKQTSISDRANVRRIAHTTKKAIKAISNALSPEEKERVAEANARQKREATLLAQQGVQSFSTRIHTIGRPSAKDKLAFDESRRKQKQKVTEREQRKKLKREQYELEKQKINDEAAFSKDLAF